MLVRSAAVVLVAALSACASPARLASGGPRGARAEFDPGAFEPVFRDVLRALRARGFAVASCDPELGRISTLQLEGDAPCGATTCLVRETAAVKLGYRRARVTVTREVWDPTLRAWRPADDEVSVAEVTREERELLSSAVVRVPGRGGDEAPCDARCDGAGCQPEAPPL